MRRELRVSTDLFIYLSCLFLFIFHVSATVPNFKSFQANAVWHRPDGTTYPVALYYDYTLQKMATVYTISGSTVKEIDDFAGNQQFQVCSIGGCQTVISKAQQLVMFYSAPNGTLLGSETKNSILCDKYTIPQPDGWTSTIWFSQSSGLIVSASFASASKSQSYDFTNVITPVSQPSIFTPSANCSSITCLAELDLVLVLDDSGSISDPQWAEAILFAIEVVNSFPNLSPVDVRIGVITFSTATVVQIGLSSDRNAIISALNNIVRQKQETGLAYAIDGAQALLVNQRQVPKGMIILTDGQPNIPGGDQTGLALAIAASQRAKTNGTTIYAAGVGALIQQKTLNVIASLPSSEFVALVANFSDLNSIKDQLIRSVCIGQTQQTCNPSCITGNGLCGCGTCLCNINCVHGATNADCSCNCSPPWQPAGDGTCTTCGWQCQNGGTAVSSCDNCNCPSPWNGTHCEQCSLGNAYCSNHGTMGTDCQCHCSGPWIGAQCTTCNWDCNGRGTKVGTCDNCNCGAPWGGAHCEICQRNNSFCVHGTINSACGCDCDSHWLKDANGACTICNVPVASTDLCHGRGNVSAVTCTGPCSCTPCKHGGSNSQDCVCSNCTSPWLVSGIDCTQCGWSSAANCNSHGNPNATCNGCTCSYPWTSTLCDVCPLTQSFCQHSSTLNSTLCSCQCPKGPKWGGIDCNTCNWGCNSRGTYNSTCNGCVCNLPWAGDTCQTCTRTNSYCAHGTINSNCVCDCPTGTGWTGSDCSTCSYDNSVCHGRGTLNSTCDGCTCTYPWSGAFCDVCALPASFCKHGSVDPASCTCSCPVQTGWVGQQCSTCTWNSSLCNSHGTFNSTACDHCDCNSATPWWTGTFCGTCSRPPNYCQHGGSVNTTDCTGCICSGGWNGSNCQTCSVAASSCVHGHLNSTTCTCNCDGGWGGATCNQCLNNPSGCVQPSVWDASKCQCNCTEEYYGVYCDNCPSSYNCGANAAFWPTLGVPSDCGCTCLAAWTKFTPGVGCPVCGLTNADCLGAGYVNTTTCSCQCNGNWVGESCATCGISAASCHLSQKFNASTCNCDCPITAATCAAKGPHWQFGPGCQCSCANSWSGVNCSVCSATCPNNQTLRNATCQCCSCDTVSSCCDGCNTLKTSCDSVGTTGDTSTTPSTGIIIAAVVAPAVAVAVGAVAVAVYLLRRKKPEPESAFQMGKMSPTNNIVDSPLFQDPGLVKENPTFEASRKSRIF